MGDSGWARETEERIKVWKRCRMRHSERKLHDTKQIVCVRILLRWFCVVVGVIVGEKATKML